MGELSVNQNVKIEGGVLKAENTSEHSIAGIRIYDTTINTDGGTLILNSSGTGLNVQSESTFESNVVAKEDVTIHRHLSVGQHTYINASLNVSNDLNVDDKLTSTGNSNIGTAGNVQLSVSNKNTTVNGKLSVAEAVKLQSTLSVNGDSYIGAGGKVELSKSGSMTTARGQFTSMGDSFIGTQGAVVLSKSGSFKTWKYCYSVNGRNKSNYIKSLQH